MKRNLMEYKVLMLLACSIYLFIAGCKKDIAGNQQADKLLSANKSKLTANSTHLDSLLAYKASNHQLMMGYYRTWGDRAVTNNAADPAMTDMPDSVDMLSVFADYTPDSSPYWTQLKNTYIPALHTKGTKVIFTGGIASVTSSTDTAGINTFARGIAAKVKDYNYDGYDIDIESTASGETLNIQKACFLALSKYLGPKSGTGKLLIYDTNQNGHALMAAIKDQVDYVFLQAYWRTAASLTSTFNTYATYITPSKFLVGVDFEDGTGEQAGQMPVYAAWQPTQGTKGGVFSYGIDNEWYNNHNATTKAAIQAMNPANHGSSIVSGATYKIVSALNNTSVLDVYASGTKVELWSNNSPTSTNQEWKVTDVGGGYYSLQPISDPTKALDVVGGASTNGTLVDVITYTGTTAQKWKITDAGGGYNSLSPACAATALLDIYGSQTTNGTKVEIWASNGGTNNQKFKFLKQ